MRPGDLVMTKGASHVVLSKQPIDVRREPAGIAKCTEVGLIIARELACDAEADNRFPEVLVLFGIKLGWAAAIRFRHVELIR